MDTYIWIFMHIYVHTWSPAERQKTLDFFFNSNRSSAHLQLQIFPPRGTKPRVRPNQVLLMACLCNPACNGFLAWFLFGKGLPPWCPVYFICLEFLECLEFPAVVEEVLLLQKLPAFWATRHKPLKTVPEVDTTKGEICPSFGIRTFCCFFGSISLHSGLTQLIVPTPDHFWGRASKQLFSTRQKI